MDNSSQPVKLYLIADDANGAFKKNYSQLFEQSQRHANMRILRVVTMPNGQRVLADYMPQPDGSYRQNTVQIESQEMLLGILRNVTSRLPAYDLFVMAHGDTKGAEGWGDYRGIFQQQTRALQQVFVHACRSGLAVEASRVLPQGVPVFTSVGPNTLGLSTFVVDAMQQLQPHGFDWSNISPKELFFKILETSSALEMNRSNHESNRNEPRIWGGVGRSLGTRNPLYTENPYETLPDAVGFGGGGKFNIRAALETFGRQRRPFSDMAISRARRMFVDDLPPGAYTQSESPLSLRGRTRDGMKFENQLNKLQTLMTRGLRSIQDISIDLLGMAYALTLAEYEPQLLRDNPRLAVRHASADESFHHGTGSIQISPRARL